MKLPAVDSLDLNVILDLNVRNGVIDTDLYIKSTDGHQYLHYQSFNPPHIKTPLLYSQALRVNRICSSVKDLKTHVSHMKE